MERRNVILALAVGILLIVLGIVGYSWWREERGVGHESAVVSFRLASDRAKNMSCEVASTPSQWGRGLSGRNSLANGTGMLFVFPTPRGESFWMKDTYIPLDMIFIGGNKTVLKVAQAPTQLGAPDDQLVRYTADDVLWVVETNMGYCAANGIIPGTNIEVTYL